MFDQMKKLMDMKKQADQIKRDLESSVKETENVQGIKIVIDGAQRFRSVHIDPSIINLENIENLQEKLLIRVQFGQIHGDLFCGYRLFATLLLYLLIP